MHPTGPTPGRVALTTAALLAVPVALLLATGVVEPVDLLLPGRRGPSAAVIRADFPGSRLRNDVGFDGQQHYALARYLPQLDRASPFLDDPQIRGQRILLPAIGALGRRGAPVVLLFLASNIAGTALAAGSLAFLLASSGRRPGLAYVAVVPLLVPVLLSTTEPLAYGLALAGVALATRGRTYTGLGALVASALTRETALIVACATAVHLALRRHFPAALACLLGPLAAFTGWHIVVRQLLAGVHHAYVRQLEPLGILHADFLNVSIRLLAIVVFVWAAFRWRDVPAVALTCLGFAAAILALAPRNLGPLALPRTAAVAEILALAAVARVRVCSTPPAAQQPVLDPARPGVGASRAVRRRRGPPWVI